MRRVTLPVCSVALALIALAQTGARPAWPRRPLMEAPDQNSLYSRYLSKQVYESLVVDDMETDRPWSVYGIGTMAYTSERAKSGKRSLRFRTNKRDDAYIRDNRKDGSFAGVQGGYAGMRLKLESPQDWSRFNRISLWVYVHPTSMRTYSFALNFVCDGAPNGVLDPRPGNTVQDLKPGEWNHVVWEIPEYKRDRVSEIGIRDTLTGHDPEDEGTVTYDFDQIEMQRVDAEPNEGWEVAPGKIAFQHVGYRPSDEKMAIAGDTGDPRFELVNAVSGRNVATFPLQPVANRRGRFQVLDFTNFTTPGQYFLRSGKTASRPFAISDDLWYGVIEKAMNFFYGERCGFDVPGVHHVCHKDWQGTFEGQTKIINGGWHDAGDLSQGAFRTSGATYAMLQIYDQLQQLNVRPDLRDRVLEEARWGLDWLLKTRFGKGYRISWAHMRIYTDNKVGTDDDVIVQARNVPFESFLFSAVGGYAARILKTVDPQRAAESLKAAEEDYRATLERPAGWSTATREEAAFGALSSVELYRATGNLAYAAQAERFARLLIQCQEQRFVDGIPLTGYFYADTARRHAVHDNHTSFEEGPSMAFRALCETFPNHADWIEWYGAAVLNSEYFFRHGAAASEPYRVIPNSVWRRSEVQNIQGENQVDTLRQFNAGTRLSDEFRLRVFPIWRDNLFHGNTAVQMAGTAGLASSALLRNDPETQSLVRRQLQWVFGGNPFSQSLMYGEGYDYRPYFAYCLRNLVGALPVGVDSRNDSPFWPSVNLATSKEIWVVPVSRLLFSLASMAMPAQVTGSAPSGAELREARTSAVVKIPEGRFSRSVPPGEYAITYAGVTTHVAFLAGAHYDLPLDGRRAIDVILTVKPAEQGHVRIEARLRGSGSHKLELRLFNGSAEATRVAVDLLPQREQIVAWNVKIVNEEKPWVAVVIPDDTMSSRQELFGTAHALARIE